MYPLHDRGISFEGTFGQREISAREHGQDDRRNFVRKRLFVGELFQPDLQTKGRHSPPTIQKAEVTTSALFFFILSFFVIIFSYQGIRKLSHFLHHIPSIAARSLGFAVNFRSVKKVGSSLVKQEERALSPLQLYFASVQVFHGKVVRLSRGKQIIFPILL